MQYSFGSGVLYGRSLTNNVPTPVRFGALQGVTIDFSFSTKELHGQYQFPIALARGAGKITGKADFAQFNAQVFNDLFFGNDNPATGATRTAVSEAKTVTSNVVNPTNNTTFASDLGVVRASDGSLFARVTSSPVGLQYSCNETTGVYSFNATQNNVPVLINYTYADAVAGKKITITNQLMGTSPTFTAVFTETFCGKSMTVSLKRCMSSKLSLVTKLEDFTSPNFDFMAYADDSGAVASISMEE